MGIESKDARFMTTRWSLVIASREGNDPVARAALATLCESYWYPLYAFLRCRRHSAEDAADLVQGLFSSLIEREDIGRANPERGSFRTFLLTALTRYAANAKSAQEALKRGGAVRLVSLEDNSGRQDAERRYALEPIDEASPERLYQATWARELLKRVMTSLEQDEIARGRAASFALFAPRLFGERDALSLEQIAQHLGTTQGAAKVALHRLRARFRASLLGEVRGTLSDEQDVQEELRSLMDSLSPNSA